MREREQEQGEEEEEEEKEQIDLIRVAHLYSRETQRRA